MKLADIDGDSLGVLTGPHQTVAPQASPRGVKRSRSPDTYGDVPSSDRGDEGVYSSSASLRLLAELIRS